MHTFETRLMQSSVKALLCLTAGSVDAWVLDPFSQNYGASITLHDKTEQGLNNSTPFGPF